MRRNMVEGIFVPSIIFPYLHHEDNNVYALLVEGLANFG